MRRPAQRADVRPALARATSRSTPRRRRRRSRTRHPREISRAYPSQVILPAGENRHAANGARLSAQLFLEQVPQMHTQLAAVLREMFRRPPGLARIDDHIGRALRFPALEAFLA